MQSDVCIAGAGIMGLAVALELTRRGARVTVLERGSAISEASFAAAGMLAVNDPANPPQLQPLADLSASLYPAFLHHIRNLSDIEVPFQTELTLQAAQHASGDFLTLAELNIFLPSHGFDGLDFTLLDEHSIDPRQLASALLTAVKNTTIQLITNTPVLSVEGSGGGVTVSTRDERLDAGHLVDCTGAWAVTHATAVRPSKGQMLSVALPESFPLSLVVRTEELYIVPRTSGPDAGRAIIGATVEDTGFDKSTYPSDIKYLFERSVRLLPALANAPVVGQWAGLRPATQDSLPILGASILDQRHLFATGHFRNGISLAPATAHLIAQVILGDAPSIDLFAFSPDRFDHHSMEQQGVKEAVFLPRSKP